MNELLHRHMRYEGEAARQRFVAYVRQGIEPFLAAIHATGDMPGVVGTDTQFMAGSEKQFEKCPMVGEWTKEMRPGYTKGARFHNGLGRWVHGQGDIIRWAKKLNKTITTPEGKVLHEGRPTEQPVIPLAEDSIRDWERKYAAQDPSLVSTPKKRKKLREDIITRHGNPRKARIAKS